MHGRHVKVPLFLWGRGANKHAGWNSIITYDSWELFQNILLLDKDAANIDYVNDNAANMWIASRRTDEDECLWIG